MTMKKLILLPFLFLAFLANAQAKYEAALGSALAQMKAANTPEEVQAVANQFSRIAEAEPKQWLPAYYAAYANVSLSFMLQEQPQRDALLDKAQTYVDRALKLQPQESELYVLQGYLHQGRLVVDPMARGMKYSALANAALEHAKELNPENPRVYFLQGQSAFNMPKMFGGGPDVAKPILTVAQEKYATYKPTSPLLPNWGEGATLALLAKCL